jgi:hypothetical protein
VHPAASTHMINRPSPIRSVMARFLPGQASSSMLCDTRSRS